MLGEIGEAVAGHLVARAVEARREVRRALGVAERRLVRRHRRTHREREAHLEQHVLLVPVDLRVELEPPRTCVETHDLPEPAPLADPPLELDLGAKRGRGEHLHDWRGGAVTPRLEVERVDVPRVELHRPILVELEPVAGRCERLAA